MTDALPFASQFSEHLRAPHQEGSSRLAKLDSLIEEAERCLQPSRCTTVGEFEPLRKRSLYLLDEFGPDFKKLRDDVDRMKSPVFSARTKAGQPLLPKQQRLCYGLLSQLEKTLRRARSVHTSRVVARPRRSARLDRLLRDVMRDNPNLQQRGICGEIDDRCATKNETVPLLPTWKRKAPEVKTLVAAYDSPKLQQSVKSFLSKRKRTSTR